EDAVVVVVVSFVPGVELNVGRVGSDIGRQHQLVVVDGQGAAGVGVHRAVVVGDGGQVAVRRRNVAAGCGHKRIVVGVVDANADVVDVVFLVAPERDGVLADDEFRLVDLHDVGRAPPVGADGRVIDRRAVVDLERGRLGIVVTPQVEVELDLGRVGEIVRQGKGNGLGALVQQVRLQIEGAIGAGGRAVGVAAAGELVMMDPVLFIGDLAVGLEYACFDGFGTRHQQPPKYYQGQQE